MDFCQWEEMGTEMRGLYQELIAETLMRGDGVVLFSGIRETQNNLTKFAQSRRPGCGIPPTPFLGPHVPLSG